MKKMAPGWALLFIAPLLGELISGHQAPLDFINPLNFLVTALPYGFGALICRELMIRWKTGRVGLVFLGLAYGLYEEAIVVRSIFNPNWLELESLQGYGHSFGINWTYAQMLLQFHVLISIYASILLAELLYPDRRDEPWLSKKGFLVCFIGLLLWLPAGFFMTNYIPPLIFIVLPVLALVGLLFLAKGYRIRINIPQNARTVKPWRYYCIGLFTIAFTFISIAITPQWQNRPPLWIIFFLVLLVNMIAFYLLLRWTRQGNGWDDRHRLALLSGLLSFFLIINGFSDFENFEGRILVTLFTIWVLLKLRRRIQNQYNEKQQLSQ